METALRVWAEIGTLWPYIVSTLVFTVTAVAALHAILVKRDPRAAIAWAGVIILAPPLGALLYFVAGVNRIRRRATRMRAHHQLHIDRIRSRMAQLVPAGSGTEHPHVHLDTDGPSKRHSLNALAQLVSEVEPRGLTGGNDVVPLLNGDQAYPEMLEAIESAQSTIALCTYIFDNDEAGRRFRDALARAVERGVEVRVMIDAVGARYTIPPITWSMRRAGINVVRFGRTVLPWRFAYFNLRNHRKVLVVDGKVGFTGGINIRQGHCVAARPKHPVKDLHFRMRGPVVHHLMEVFALDWSLTTGETLSGELWFPPPERAGSVKARGINDGPDEDFDRLRWVILGACASAERSIQILTPYFIPDQGLVTALAVAAMRGVHVDVILPETNNLAFVEWASRAYWSPIIKHGCRLHLTHGEFDHSKLMVVDREWVLMGSANLDPRSLRLNFEFNVECYSTELADELTAIINDKLKSSHKVSMTQLEGRSFPLRLRDAVARLFSPYL